MKTKTLAYYYYYFKIILVLFKLLSWIHFFFSKRFILVTVAILSLGLNPGWDANPEHIHAVMPVHLLACLLRGVRKPENREETLELKLISRSLSRMFKRSYLQAALEGQLHQEDLLCQGYPKTATVTVNTSSNIQTHLGSKASIYVLVFQLKRWYYLAAWQSWDTLTSIYCWQTLWERNQKCSTLVLRFVCTIIETLIWMNVDLQLLL